MNRGGKLEEALDNQTRVVATTDLIVCANGSSGLRIDLSFDGSSRNIERRIDRIEIQACPRIGDDGELFIDATGALYEGRLPRDPELNAFEENIGAKALQTAFLKQVPAVFDAVERSWEESGS